MWMRLLIPLAAIAAVIAATTIASGTLTPEIRPEDAKTSDEIAVSDRSPDMSSEEYDDVRLRRELEIAAKRGAANDAAAEISNTTRATTTTTTTNLTGTDCFASPGSCGYPDPAYGNVGVPPGTTLTARSGMNISTTGTVVNGAAISGGVNVYANNVTIENSTITCSCDDQYGEWIIYVAAGVQNFTLKNVTLDGGAGTANGVWNVGATGTVLDHVYAKNVETIYHDDSGSGTVENSYQVSQIAIDGDHAENIYNNNDTLDVEHDTFFNPQPQTSVINGGAGTGGSACSNHLTVNNSLLAGGGYTIYACQNATGPGSSVVSITNNHFARCTTTPMLTGIYGYNGITCGPGPGGCTSNCDSFPAGQTHDANGYYRQGGYFGYDDSVYCSSTTWSGNVWDDNGTSISC